MKIRNVTFDGNYPNLPAGTVLIEDCRFINVAEPSDSTIEFYSHVRRATLRNNTWQVDLSGEDDSVRNLHLKLAFSRTRAVDIFAAIRISLPPIT